MPRYAAKTEVTPERSRAEIEETLRRYGASEFHSGWKPGEAVIGFRIDNLFVRFKLPLPDKAEKRFTHKTDRSGFFTKRTDQQAAREWDQEVRQRWRALLLVIKAKLEAVECKISSLESEFLAHIVLPNDQTMGEWIITDMLPSVRAGKMPLLGYQPASGPVTEAEVVEEKKEITP